MLLDTLLHGVKILLAWRELFFIFFEKVEEMLFALLYNLLEVLIEFICSLLDYAMLDLFRIKLAETIFAVLKELLMESIYGRKVQFLIVVEGWMANNILHILLIYILF